MNWEQAFKILEPIPDDDYVGGHWPAIRYEKIKALFELAGMVANGCIVELGTWRGLAAAAMALGVRDGITVHTVDNYQPWSQEMVGVRAFIYGSHDYDCFLENMKKIPPEAAARVVQHRVDVRELAKDWTEPVALLVWDIWGDRLFGDIQTWERHVPPGGLCAVKVFEDGRLEEEKLYQMPGWEAFGGSSEGLIVALRRKGER